MDKSATETVSEFKKIRSYRMCHKYRLNMNNIINFMFNHPKDIEEHHLFFADAPVIFFGI